MSAAPFGFSDNITFLAPMQDITDASFMQTIADYGSPDFYIAEYFRIHEYFELEEHILKTVTSLPGGRPVAAQFIGENTTYIAKAIEEIKKYPQIKMLDLNLGCPAPKVYRKNVGGGLLRDKQKIREISQLMRSNWSGIFSVKMRTGFDTDADFASLLECVLEASPDFITVHARTVKQLYHGEPNYDMIKLATSISPVPIIANGDIFSPQRAIDVVTSTSCAGVMVGRHAVRNPWIFRQIKEAFEGKEIFRPTLADVRGYIDKLYKNTVLAKSRMKFVDSRLKKFLNFIGVGVDENGEFLYNMRRAKGIDALLEVCDKHLLKDGNDKKLFALEPYPNLCARPNHEDTPQ